MENKETNNQQKVDKVIRHLDEKAIIIGLIGIFVLFVFPILVTQFNLFFDFSNTGQIGDTIGGLTSPIIGFFSALLIYFSFRAQINANLIVQGQIDQQRKEEAAKREFNYQMEICKHIKEIINNYEQIDKKHFNGSDLKGSLALNAVLHSLKNKKENDNVDDILLKPIKSILYQIDTLIKSFKNKEIDNLDIRLPLEIICFTFEAHIMGNSRNYINDVISKHTVVPENIFNLYFEIDNIDKELEHLYLIESMRNVVLPW